MIRRQQIFNARTRQQGFTLVEVMVALIVLSVGMLGIAALFTQGLSAGRTAIFRTQAVNLVSDLADRIRANRSAQAAYAGAAGDNNCDPLGGGGVDCAPAQMAAHDLFVWDQQVQQNLPDGEWLIQFNAAALPPSYTIRVSWAEVGQVALIQHQMLIQVPPII